MYLMIDICEFILMKSVPQDRIKHLIKLKKPIVFGDSV